MCAALPGPRELAPGPSCAAPASLLPLLEGLGSAQRWLPALQMLSSTQVLVGEAKGQILGMGGGDTDLGSSEESLHVERIWLLMDLRVFLELGSPPWRSHALRL